VKESVELMEKRSMFVVVILYNNNMKSIKSY
jgi:hypothetical protein